MDRIADLGGTEGWGRVKAPTADEPVFSEPWESRAFALALLSMGRVSGRNLDAFRHALERLEQSEYFDDTYYGRWLHAAELMLVESAIHPTDGDGGQSGAGDCHAILPERFACAHLKEMRCDSRFDAKLGSSTSIM